MRSRKPRGERGVYHPVWASHGIYITEISCILQVIMSTDLKFFDAHTHTNLAAFRDDYREAVGRMLDAGGGLINVGTQKDTSRRAVEIAHEFSSEGGDAPVFAAVGLHPIHTSASFHDEEELGPPFAPAVGATGGKERRNSFMSRSEIFDHEYYKKLALDPKVVGIGECGLDYYRIENNELGIREKQIAAFEEQIKLAHEVQKPLMIHCRKAFNDLIDIIIHNSKFLIQDNPGIIHFFTGTKEDAAKLLELGFSFTFGGVVTFPPRAGKREGDYDEVIKFLPLDRILSETDAPYVAPVPYRGKRNEPMYVQEVVKKLAELKEISEEEMRSITVKNTKRVFGLA